MKLDWYVKIVLTAICLFLGILVLGRTGILPSQVAPTKDPSAKYAGHWSWEDQDITLSSDKTALGTGGNKGTWTENNGEIVIKWNDTWIDVLRPDTNGQYTDYGYPIGKLQKNTAGHQEVIEH